MKKKFMALSLAILMLVSMTAVLPASAIIQYDVVCDQNFTAFTTAADAKAALKTYWNAGHAESLTAATDASILWSAADGFTSSSWAAYAQTSSKVALSSYRFTTKLRATGPQWAAIAVRESLTNAKLPAYGSGNVVGKSTQGITFTLASSAAATTTTMSVIIRNSTSLDAADTVFTVPFPSYTANYFGIADRTIVITDTPEEITFSADGHLIARVTIDTTSTNADGSYNKGEVFDGSGTSKGTFSAADNAKIPASGMIDIFQRNNIFSLKSLKLEKEFSFDTLEAKIAEAETYQAASYTTESYAVLSEKITAAENLMLQQGVTMAEVDNAILAIDNAIAGLTWAEDYFMLKPENGAKADKINIGSTVFLDRAYKVASLPSQFINAGYICSTIAASSYTAIRPGYVYAITPVSTGTNSQASKLLERGFRKTSIASFNLFGQTETLEVYTKYIYAGTTIVTGGWAVTIFSETNLLADIGEFDGPMAILNLPANETKEIMKPGALIFSGNTKTFLTVPDYFSGRGYIQSGIDAVSFTTKEEGYVYAITPDTGDFNKAAYLEQSGFVKTAIPNFNVSGGIGEAVSTYRKYFAKDETFTCTKWVIIVCSELDEIDNGQYVRPELLLPTIYTSPDASYYKGARLWQGIPGIERASNGRLWATWFSGGTQEPRAENYVIVGTSMDNGATWKEPIVIIDPRKGDARAYDPVPWIDPTGKLWIFWTQAVDTGYPYLDFGIWAITTDDPTVEHPVWSEPKRYGDGVMLNKPIILSTGEWMLSSSCRTTTNSSKVYMSTNNGDTWELQGAATIRNPICDENMLVEKNDGSLWLLARTSASLGGIDECFSYDKGKTWTLGAASVVTGPESRFHIRRLKSGNLLLVNNYNFTGRNNMTALLSTDDGATWPYHLTLDERSGVTYPDAIEAPDGKIYAVYDYNRYSDKQILMSVFTEEDIIAGAFISEGSGTKLQIKESRRAWSFDNDSEGFAAQNNVTFDNSVAGILGIDILGSGAYMQNNSVSIDSKYSKIKIRLKNTTDSGDFKVNFGTSTSPAIDATKTKTFATNTQMADFEEFIFDMGDASGWAGEITNLRFAIADTATSGTVYIDSIEFYTSFDADTIYTKDGVETSHIDQADGITVKINEDADDNIVPVLAVYTKDSKALVKCIVGTKGQKEISVSGIIPGQMVKFLCLDGIQSLKPLIKAKVLYDIDKNHVYSTVDSFSVAGIFSDNMVLQRNKPICIYGTSTDVDGKIITANLGTVYGSGTVQNGQWEVLLPPLGANADTQTLSINGVSSSKAFENILVGDVYFAAGQSNMEFSVLQSLTASDAFANANDSDNIRLFYQSGAEMMALSAADPRVTTPQQNPYNSAYKWELANAATISKFSAVAYYFAKKIQDTTNANVPIGLIQTAVGGSSLAGNTPSEINALFANGDFNWPSRVYNSMIAPVERFTAKGILWYQGETDSIRDEDIANYDQRFIAFLENWKQKNKGDLDVYGVQLSSHPAATGWQLAKFRAMQIEMLSQIDNYYLAVAMDKGAVVNGDPGHPPAKREVGDRLANIALMKRNIINENDALSPLVSSISYGETDATITFNNIGTGLSTSNNEPIKGFELIKDGVAVQAEATITSPNTILVTGTQNPTGVRYAYYCAAGTNMANVLNSNGLPLGTFADNSAQIPPLFDGFLDGWDIEYKTAPSSLGLLAHSFDLSQFTVSNATKGELTYENSVLRLTVNAQDVYLLYPAINVASENRYLKIRYKNESMAQDFQIYWTTDIDPSYNETKSTYVSIAPNTTGYVDWYIDMSKYTAWKDTITGIRIDPIDKVSEGSINIESMELYGYRAQTAWTFEPSARDTGNYANGWQALSLMSFAKEDNNLKITILGADAYMMNTGLNVSTTTYKKVKIRFKNLSQGSSGELFYGTTASPNISGTQRKAFVMNTNMTAFEDVIIDMSDVPGWTTNITQLRLDLANNAPSNGGTVYVQSIEFIE